MDAVGALRARIRLESPARSADNIGGAALNVTVDANTNGTDTLTVKTGITAGTGITAVTITFAGSGNNDKIIGPDFPNTWNLDPTNTNAGKLVNAGFSPSLGPVSITSPPCKAERRMTPMCSMAAMLLTPSMAMPARIS